MKRKIFNVLLAQVLMLVFSLAIAIPALAIVTVTPASEGNAISADAAGVSGTYTSLGPITINEGAAGYIAVGTNITLVLNVPNGFEFNDNPLYKPDISSAGGDISWININSITTSQLTVAMTVNNTSMVDTITIGSTKAIRVRPTAGTPLVSGQIYRPSLGGGNVSILGITSSDQPNGSGGTNFGTLTEVTGALDHINVSSSNPSVTAGGSQTYTAQGYDKYNNPISSLTYAWSCTNATAGSINPSTGVFTAGTSPGSYPNIINASSGNISGTSSVTIVVSGDASLSNLTISSGNLVPVFASDTLSYTGSVGNSVTSVTVTPTAKESHAGVKVNGAAVTSGSPSGAISLNVGSNTITIVVTAQGGTTKTYGITVTRADVAPVYNPGGGGGGGGAPPSTPTPVSGTGQVSWSSAYNGVTSVTVTVTSNDKASTVNIPKGTTALTNKDVPLGTITCNPPATPAPALSNWSIIALYDIGPSGASFNPPITITITYDPASLPGGYDPGKLILAYYDINSNSWPQINNAVINTDNHTITGTTSHLTQFGILFPIAKTPAPTPTPIPSPNPSPNPSPSRGTVSIMSAMDPVPLDISPTATPARVVSAIPTATATSRASTPSPRPVNMAQITTIWVILFLVAGITTVILVTCRGNDKKKGK